MSVYHDDPAINAELVHTHDDQGALIAGPLTCGECGRFVSVKDARLFHEFGDYGSILSTEVVCPKCVASTSDELGSSPSSESSRSGAASVSQEPERR